MGLAGLNFKGVIQRLSAMQVHESTHMVVVYYSGESRSVAATVLADYSIR